MFVEFFKNLLGFKLPERADARVYMHRQYLDQYLCRLLTEGRTLLITFFPSTRDRIKHLCHTEQSIQLYLYTPQMTAGDFEKIRSFASVPGHHIAFAERYPVQNRETEIIEKLRNAGIQSPVSAYSALDDEFMVYYGGDRIIAMMKNMGMKEDESLDHPMISGSIHNAQRKTGKKIKFEQSARSPEEWMRLNLPRN